MFKKINMCRFLIISSKEEFQIKDYLYPFSKMCENSFTPDGDRQKDGWGCLTSKQFYKSIQPIWKEKNIFDIFLNDNLFIAHCRSASNSIIDLEFNQPFIKDSLVFVFNGLLKGVKIDIEGKIGAQKLFNLILDFYKREKSNFLENLYQYILQNSEFIVGMNIGLIDLSLKRIYLISVYHQHKDYFQLNLFEEENLIIISSEEFANLNFQKLPSPSLLTLDLK
ncbi:MAG: hypothetical protein NZ866_01985 [Patescibacteria group bacterium]|nr:hypothetical protein [Patescibacteria group bacterium]